MARKILKTAIALAFLAGFGILGYSIVSKWYGKKYGETDRTELTDNLTEIEYNNGETGVLNHTTDKVIGRYDKILRTFLSKESTHFTYIVVKDNLRGYISTQTGEVIFEPQFLYAWLDDPESGLAACVDKDHKLGFVNVRTKKIVIPFQFDYNENLFAPYGYSMLDFVFSNGICIVPGKDGKIGMIDKTGKVLLPTKYSDIINWRDANTPNIILKKDASADSEYQYVYGICDRNFKMTVPFGYNSFEKNTDYTDDGDIYVKNYIVSKEDKYGVLDTLFNTILPLKYDQIEAQNNSYLVELKGKYGVLDSNLKTILPAEYDWIYATYTDGNYDNCKYIVKKNFVQKLYDEKGKLLNDFYIEKRDGEYDYEKEEYVNNSAFESVCEPHQTILSKYIQYYLDGRYGMIDGNNRVVIPAKYDKIEYLGNGNFVCTEEEYSFLIKDKK